MSLRPFAKITLIAALSVGSASTSLAEELTDSSAAPKGELTEIIIRGTNLPDSALEFPGSVSVVTPEEVVERGDDHFQQLIDTVPNLNWAGGSSRPTFFQIRGVGEVEQYEGAPNPSVGVFIDDIDFSGMGGALTLFDLSQLEVLRGSQNVRFGANAMAGVISATSEAPTPYWTGQSEFSLGQDDLIAGGAAVGGALDGTNEKVQFRVSAYQHSSDGNINNDFLGRSNTNRRDEFTGRFKLAVIPSSNFRIDLTGIMVDLNNGYDAFSIDNSRTTQSDKPGSDTQNTNGGLLRVTAGIGTVSELVTTVAATESSLRNSYDGDWGNDDLWSPYLPYDYFSAAARDPHRASGDLRVRSKENQYVYGETERYTAGFYAERFRENGRVDNYFQDDAYDELQTRYKAYTYAGFAEYEYPLSPATVIRTGARIEQRDTDYSDSRSNTGGPDNLMWGGDITVEHRLAEEIFVYTSATRGFKGGGINTSIAIPDELREFDPESMYTFEAGLNGEFLGGKLSNRLSPFLILRRDVQTKYSFQNNPEDPLSFTYLTDNVARGRNYGLENELSYRPVESLALTLSGSLLNTEFTSVGSGNPDLEGREQSHSPSYQFASSATYYFSDGLFARVDYSGKDGFYYQDSHNQRSSPYYLLGASVGYRSANWRIVLWGHNLTNETYAVRGFYFGTEPPDFPEKEYVQLGDPRQIGLTATFSF